jgi:hypothetical protein
LFRRCLTRPPERHELDAACALHETALERFRRVPRAADQLLAEAAKGRSADVRAKLAAWTTVVRGLMNLDEAITRE